MNYLDLEITGANQGRDRQTEGQTPRCEPFLLGQGTLETRNLPPPPPTPSYLFISTIQRV